MKDDPTLVAVTTGVAAGAAGEELWSRRGRRYRANDPVVKAFRERYFVSADGDDAEVQGRVRARLGELAAEGLVACRVGRREIGHLHGDHAAHFVFPKDVWADLFEAGRVVDHPVFPGRAGPAARRIENDDDVDDVIRLMRLNYDRVVAKHGLPVAA